MNKKLSLALLLTVSIVGIAVAAEQNNVGGLSGVYTLDVDKADSYQLDELIKNAEENAASLTAQASTPQKSNISPKTDDKVSPKVITETTPNGKIEKLVDVDGRVIAEKTIENDKIVKKVLNYYYPEGALMRQIVAKEDNSSFYAEEYYNNGKIAAQATYINEANKIGKEKRYDAKGTLRQEIPWEVIESDKTKPLSEQKTTRLGEVITYYPNGNIAARFPVGQEGKSIFYNRLGLPIKTIEGKSILNFSKELTAEDCQHAELKLDLDELVKLYEDEGDISYNKCGMPYRESFMYEVMDVQGKVTLVLSYDETGMLRRITPYLNGKKDGIAQKFDAAGNITAEINYKEGLKEGYATGYFPNNNPAFLKKYEKGLVEGTMNCYFPDGKIAAQFSYKNGLKEGQAIVNSPIKKTLEFSEDKLLNNYQQNNKRQLTSALKDLSAIEAQCLNVESRISEVETIINKNIQEVNKEFAVEIPQECKDMGTFAAYQGLYYCYNADKKRLATYPVPFIRGEYVMEKVYTPEGKLRYDISYKDKQRQGWTKRYNDNGQTEAEIYYNKDKISGSSRSYYPSGRVKDLQTISDDKSAKVIAHYDDTGTLEFSLTYDDKDAKQEGYILSPDKRKDIIVRYYEGKPDSVRESNAADPYNFIEYNFALGEYTIYQNNKLVKGGHLCNQPAKDIVENESVNVAAINEIQKAAAVEVPPVIGADNAPLVEEVDNSPTENKISSDAMANVIIKTPEEEQQAKLAAQNIGPIAKPDIEDLADVVQKETINNDALYAENESKSKTVKLYYPNGSLRKTIKTRGSRTEEIKEYSKTGLLLTDYMYNADNITIEKYFGSGQVRRKTEKTYDDNAIMAFMSREDFYDTGNARYSIRRQPDSLLFKERINYPDGSLKSETEQTYPLSFVIKEYDTQANLVKETEQAGLNQLIKEYDSNHGLRKLAMNGKDIPLNMAQNSKDLFADNARIYDAKGKLSGSFKSQKDYNEILSYYGNGKVKTEVMLYKSGEISVKKYNSAGNLEKFAHLSPDGKLHIEKPEMRVIPSYRERYWVDYNNPNWIENQEKYSVKSIAKLNLNLISKIMTEIGIEEPEIITSLNKKYE